MSLSTATLRSKFECKVGFDNGDVVKVSISMTICIDIAIRAKGSPTKKGRVLSSTMTKRSRTGSQGYK